MLDRLEGRVAQSASMSDVFVGPPAWNCSPGWGRLQRLWAGNQFLCLKKDDFGAGPKMSGVLILLGAPPA
jgi:hypothetical protein